MSSGVHSPLYYLPLEVIDQVVSSIQDRPETWHSSKETQADFLSITRMERIGGNRMSSGERMLLKKIKLSMEDLEPLRFLAQLQDSDRRLRYIEDLRFDGSAGESSMATFVPNLSSLLIRSSSLKILFLNVDRGVWNQVQPSLFHLKRLTDLTLGLIPAKNERKSFSVTRPARVSLAILPPLPQLEQVLYHNELSFSAEHLPDLFGGTVRPNLRNVTLEEVTYSKAAPFLHLWPKLADLSIEFDKLSVLSSLPQSLRCLSFLNCSSKTIEEFKILDLGVRPFHLTTLNIYCEEDDFSFLPFMPRAIQSLKLMMQGFSSLTETLQSCKPGELGIKKLSLYDTAEPEESEFAEGWELLVKECQRLGIAVQGG